MFHNRITDFSNIVFERSLLHFSLYAHLRFTENELNSRELTHVFFADKTKHLITSFRLPLSSRINRKTLAVVWSQTCVGDSEVSVNWIFASNPLHV